MKELNLNDLATVGGKNASLGEMLQELSPKGISVPDGYVVTTEGYKAFISHNNL